MLQRVVRNIHSAECSRAVISNCLWSTVFTMKNDYVPHEAKYNKSKGFLIKKIYLSYFFSFMMSFQNNIMLNWHILIL